MRPDSVAREDQHLVDAVRSGCRIAFTELWNLYSRRVYLTTFKIVKNSHDAEDALQDAFLRAFLSIASFEDRASFYTWVTRIAINSALGILRRRSRKPETSIDATPPREDHSRPYDFIDSSPGPEQIFDRRQRHAGFTRAMYKLPAGHRDVVQMLLTENCTVKEAARQLNISYAAAKSRLYRSRAIIGASIAAHGTPGGHASL